MSDMGERIARGICRRRYMQMWEDASRIDDVVERRWRDYADEAQAIIADMREPTAAMVEAATTRADPQFDPPTLSPRALSIWWQMIDAALTVTIPVTKP